MSQEKRNLSRTGGLIVMAMMLAGVAGLGYFASRAVDERRAEVSAKDDNTDSESSDTQDVLDILTGGSDSDDGDTGPEVLSDTEDSMATHEANTESDTSDGNQEAVVPSTGVSSGTYVFVAIITIFTAVTHRAAQFLQSKQ